MRSGGKYGLRLGEHCASGETCLLLTALRTSVTLGALSTDRELLAMPHTAPCTDVLEALDIETNLAGELTFCEFLFDACADACLVCVGDGICLGYRVDVEFIHNRLRKGTTDALHVCEGDNDLFIAWEDDTGDTKHEIREEGEELTLTLLVLRILAADDSARRFAETVSSDNETAVFADGFAGGADFHADGGVAEGVEAPCCGALGFMGLKR